MNLKISFIFVLFAFIISSAAFGKNSSLSKKGRSSLSSEQAHDTLDPTPGAPASVTVKQLYCKDLKAGDIMLKYVSDKDPITWGVKWFQKKARQTNERIVHAGIMLDNINIVESGPFGLEKNSLVKKFPGNAHIGYIIYRATNSNMAAGAGNATQLFFDIHKKRKTIKYSYGKVLFSTKKSSNMAPKSSDKMEKIFDKILVGKNGQRMFCSQFIVYLYQWTALQQGIDPKEIFNIDDGKATPAKLAEILQDNPAFYEVGYMIGNER